MRKSLTKFVTFQGAAVTFADDANELPVYKPRGEITLNPERIDAVYDHTIIIGGHKIRVMENYEEIKRKVM